MSHADNVARIKMVYDALEEIAGEVVFVGGATVSLYADRPAGESRPTEDVDILVEVAGRKGYANIEDKLRKKGFAHDASSQIICRYIINSVVVDVMPTDENILGFSNRWYEQAFATALKFPLDDGYNISIMRPAFFLATKLEAFKNRGRDDGRLSTDFEDIVFVLNNRTAIWQELEDAAPEVRAYLRETFSVLSSGNYLREWLGAHLEYNEQRRVQDILRNINSFALAERY
jgi:predicted nucleotidyltransferase